jgi:hypothetical protein
MSEIGFYHPSWGYWQTTGEPSEQTSAAYPNGTKQVPLKPGPGYNYDGVQWVAPTQEWLDNYVGQLVRAQRAAKLYYTVDPVAKNPLRWGGMSYEEQAEWAAYRQALLDITEQSGFPHSVVWPVKP